MNLPIISKKVIAKETVEIGFGVLGKKFSFQAGQYVRVIVPNLVKEDLEGPGRQFSIVSSPNNKVSLEIAFRISDSGFKQTLLNAPIGSTVEIQGPFGSFVLPKDFLRPVVFMAGGTGITPFLSMLRYAAEEKLPHKITLLYANKSPETALYIKELEQLAKLNQNFRMATKFGALDAEFVRQNIQDVNGALFYISGPSQMVDDLRETLDKMGTPAERIYFEDSRKLIFLGAANQVLSLIGASPDGIAITDLRGIFQYANPAWQQLTGWRADEVIGKVTPRILKSDKHDKKFYEKMWEYHMKGKTLRTEIIDKRKDGSFYDTDEVIEPLRNAAGGIIGFAAFQRDITERKQIERMRSEFVTIVSHQFRTPLTSIKWLLELILSPQGEPLTTNQKSLLLDIRETNERLITLHRDLLNLSHLETGRLEITPVFTDLVFFFKQSISELMPKIKERRHRLIFNKPRTVSLVAIDEILLKHAFQNILLNAIQYTKAGGKIIVSLEEQDKEILVSIQDTGIGMSEEFQKRVFERFARAPEAFQMEPDGSGLGLYITKLAIEKLKGRIWFESQEGKGTTFYFTLPKT